MVVTRDQSVDGWIGEEDVEDLDDGRRLRVLDGDGF